MRKNIFLKLFICILTMVFICPVGKASFAEAHNSKLFYPAHNVVDMVGVSNENRIYTKMLNSGVAKFSKNEETGVFNFYPLGPLSFEGLIAVTARAMGYGGEELDGSTLKKKIPNLNDYWSRNELKYFINSGIGNNLIGELASNGRSFSSVSIYELDDQTITTFMANYRKNIRIKDVAALMVRLVGYEQRAIDCGGWPHGYMQVADELGLFEGTDFSAATAIHEHVTRIDEIIILHNALNTPLMLSTTELNSGIRNYTQNYKDSNHVICDGINSDRYETLYTFGLKYYTVLGKAESTSNGMVKFNAMLSDNFAGEKYGNGYPGKTLYFNPGDIPLDKINGNYCEVLVKYDPTESYKHNTIVFAAILEDSQINELLKYNTGSLTIATKDGKTEGYSTINNEQGTGTNFIFTAVTSPEVKEISILADLHNGEAWHEITYDYLKKHYYLDEHINVNNEKVWTCRFDINDVGYRTFILKTDGAETDIKANVTVLPNITVMVNGNKLEFDVPPQIIDGRTLVPVRAIFEVLGAKVEWNAEQQAVTARNTNYWAKLVLGSTTMECAQPNSTWQYTKTLDVPATAIDGRTMVPARAVGEAFGCKVDWDAETSTVIINEYN